MKSGLAILTAALLMVCMLPSSGVAAPDDGPTFSRSYPVSLTGDQIEASEVVGPQRDWGEDWIQYDDGNGRYLLHWGDAALWSRTRFTPPADFLLEGVSFQVNNNNDIDPDDAPCRVYVYSEDQDDMDLEDILWEGEADELPDNEWIDIEIPEDDYQLFDADEHFSIIYGPAPSRNPDAGGQGWWNCLDAATEVHRSFVAQEDGRNPPTDHENDWYGFDSDLLLRANGTFQDDFFDVGISGLYNDTEMWLMYPGTEQVFTALVFYGGQPADFATVSFNVFDSEGNAFWEEPPEIILEDPFEDMEPGDVLEVECDRVWSTEEVGTYIVRAVITIQNDANGDNDSFGMEQLVFDPAAEDPIWLGYCDETSETQFSGTEDEGWMVAFAHPGGHETLWLERFRYWMDNSGNEDPVECRFRIGFHDDRGWGWMMAQTFTAEIAADEEGWVEIELSPEERDSTSFPEGAEILVSYQYSGLSLKSDGTPPISGVNPDMPGTMWVTIENGQRAGETEAGDYMCQVQLGVSDIAPAGKHLRIEPDPIEFGYNLELDTEYAVEATFTSYGDQDVTIRAIQIAGAGVDYLTCDHLEEFVIEAGGEEIVTITFQTSEDIELDTRLRVINDSDNMSNQYTWNIHASTYPSAVDDDPMGIPAEYALQQNHPNPFNPTTSIGFALKTAGNVELNVYDMSGRMVKEVVNGRLSAGYHNAQIDASDLSAGIYLYRLNAGDFTDTQKMILLR